MVILNYRAARPTIRTTDFTKDPSQVILAWCDNISAIHWVKHACMKSLIGREHDHFFCTPLINAPVGINARWLSTYDNVIADEVSWIKENQQF